MTQYISIKDASEMSGKSIQTIRRMIKSKKLRYRKDRTPQGFNYLIELSSLAEMSKISPELIKETLGSTTQATQASAPVESQQTVATEATYTNAAPVQAQAEVTTQPVVTTNLMEVSQERSHQQIVAYEPIKEFNDTMQKLIDQHGKEKENLFRLIETFQNKVISLENKIKVESSSKKSWFKLW